MYRVSYIMLFLIFVGINMLQARGQGASQIKQIVIAEVLQVENYTYLRASGQDSALWLAVPRREVNPGDTLYFSGGAQMGNFRSKELKKSFESILFVSKIGTSPEAIAFNGLKRMPHGAQNSNVNRQELKVEPLKDGITLAQLFENRDQYKDKVVKIRARVVKFNTNIMGKNWAHIQDGTCGNGKYDLLINTTEMLEKDTIYIFTGNIVLDKDFGAGYQYEELMEDAQIVK